MSVQAASSQNAYNYLQSLLQQQTGITNGQTSLQTLLDEFFPTSASAPTSSASASAQTNANSSCEPPGSGLSSDTFGALISLQGNDPVAAKAQSIFAGLDSNGDGSVSQSEFESAFGSGADTSKVDALFNSLDANGDGSVSQGELTSAAEASHAHHHRHAHGGGGGGGQGGLQELMSAISGANSQTTSNSDGSTSTTITYADGSSVVLNSAPSGSLSASSDSSSGGTGQQTIQFNLLEKLIQMQSQLINGSSSTGSSALLSV